MRSPSSADQRRAPSISGERHRSAASAIDQRRAPILCTGNDFSRTDVAIEPLA